MKKTFALLLTVLLALPLFARPTDAEDSIPVFSQAGTPTVYEAGLPNGTHAGDSAYPTTATGSASIIASNGLDKVSINDVLVVSNNAIQTSSVVDSGLKLTLTGFSESEAGKYNLTFAVELTQALSIFDSTKFSVTVWDKNNYNCNEYFYVNVVDDRPTLSVSQTEFTLAPGQYASGSYTYAYGANGAGDLCILGESNFSRVPGKNGYVYHDRSDQTFTYYAKADAVDGSEDRFILSINDASRLSATSVNIELVFKIDKSISSGTPIIAPTTAEHTIYESKIFFATHVGDGDFKASGTLTYSIPEGFYLSDLLLDGTGTDPNTPGITSKQKSTGHSHLKVGLGEGNTIYYEYRLSEASPTTPYLEKDTFVVELISSSNARTSATLVFHIVDDEPQIYLDPPTQTVTAGKSVSGEYKILFGYDSSWPPFFHVNGNICEYDTQAYTIVGQYGTLSLEYTGDFYGTYAYIANAGIKTVCTDTFTFRVEDNDGDIAEQTLTITVHPASAASSSPAPSATPVSTPTPGATAAPTATQVPSATDAPAPTAAPTENSAAYTVTSGANAKWKKDSRDGLAFTVQRSKDDEKTFSAFTGIEVDGKAVDAQHFDAAAGSLKLTVKPSYLKTLSVGKHTITVLFQDGKAETGFTVRAAGDSDVPQTADNSLLPLWAGLLLLCGAALTGLRKRKMDR